MAKVHSSLRSLSDSLKPEIKQYNDQLTAEHVSDLESQASSLLADINGLWSGYEASYQPAVYRRSGAVRNGFYLSEPRVTGHGPTTKIEIDLVLDDGLMWHSSLFGGNRGHAFMLISEGWNAPALKAYRGGEDTYRLTTFDGIGIVDTLINKYNTSNHDFQFFYEGNEYNGKRDRGNHSFTG